MKRIGAHVSTSGGVFNAPVNAAAIGAKAFALFTKNQRQWDAKPLDKETIRRFKEELEKNGYKPEQVLAHDGYLINIGNPQKDAREKSFHAFLDELERCEQLGLPYLNIHPGSHLRLITEDECMKLISECVNRALDKTKTVSVVFENTAGQGSNIGYRFEHLARIIDRIDNKKRVGICFDTCHAFCAGYDLRTRETYTKTMQELDSIVGLTYLRGMHCNDAKGKFGGKLDRHESIGKGTLGLGPFKYIMNDARFDEIPLILETPYEEQWKEEILLLYSFCK